MLEGKYYIHDDTGKSFYTDYTDYRSNQQINFINPLK